MSNTRAGLLALAVVAVATFLGFSKDVPFVGKRFELNAVFTSATSIRPNSPVRIAGVEVGKVASVRAQPGTEHAVVTMEIEEQGLPIHADATAKIRPRIFLEGNFFVDLEPGTPRARVLRSGDAIKVTRTAVPVQLDQVLSALQGDTREDLRDVLAGLGGALDDPPTRAQVADGHPLSREQTAARSLNDTYEHSAPALRGTARVGEALLGERPETDIGRLVRGLGRAAGGLARDEAQLGDLVGNLRATMAALADRRRELGATVRTLAPTLEQANSALAVLNSSFPPTRAFAREALPGVREAPGTLAAALPWTEQARKLVSRAELRGLARDLAPAAPALATLARDAVALLAQVDLASLCATETVLPTGNVKITNTEFPTGVENYKEFIHALVGLSGEGQNFDGNGIYVRFQPGGGTTMVSLGDAGTPGGRLFGNAFPGVGVRPRRPPRRPPYDASVPCHRSPRPDVNGPASAKGPFESPAGGGTGVSAARGAGR